MFWGGHGKIEECHSGFSMAGKLPARPCPNQDRNSLKNAPKWPLSRDFCPETPQIAKNGPIFRGFGGKIRPQKARRAMCGKIRKKCA